MERAFGRMEYGGLSVSSEAESGTAALVSYEEKQFGWAREELNRGDLDAVCGGTTDILVSYRDGMLWQLGDVVTLHAPLGEKQVRIAGILSSANASCPAGSLGYIICSEELFTESVGAVGYAAIDVQLGGGRLLEDGKIADSGKPSEGGKAMDSDKLADGGKLTDSGSDRTVSAIRSLLPADCTLADKRLSNEEAQSSYYTGAVFIYGFLIVIALITVFNIFNSMNASVAARTRQYGVMRSIGMCTGQLYRMIAAEAAAYAVLGCIAGRVLGLPLNKMMFRFLIADKWGISWRLPAPSLALIVILCFSSAALAIRRPIRKIGRLSIVDTIKQQQ